MFELTRNYDIVLPLIATVAIGTLTIDLIEYSNVDPTWGWWWAPSLPQPAPSPPPALISPLSSELSARQQDRDRTPSASPVAPLAADPPPPPGSPVAPLAGTANPKSSDPSE